MSTASLKILHVFKISGVATLLMVSHSASAQNNPLQQGVNTAMYGRCMVDVLTPDRMQMAAALGALAPAELNRLAPAPDEMAQIEHMCAHQLHQHRCSAKIVAAVGSAITSQHPAGKAAPPTANPGALLGGTAGAVLGTIAGSDRGLTGAMVGGAAGAWGGAKVGSNLFDNAAAAACINAQSQLDAIASRLQGSIRTYSAQGVQALIENNRQNQVITAAEAADLNGEVMRLAGRAQDVLKAAQ